MTGTAAPMTDGALDYCMGGAGDERTMHRNTELLDQLVLVPRMLRAEPEPVLRTSVVGGEIAAPVLVSPMGLQALAHPAAEAATAAAAAGLGLGHCLSTFSSVSPADVVSQAGPGLRWFQLYILRDPGLTAYLVGEAERLGFAAIVCTLDVPVVGRRTRDETNGFDRFAVAPPAVVRAAPFRALQAERGCSAKQLLDAVFPNPSCTWDDVATLIGSTDLPVLLKGILHPADARRAVAVGAAGIVVSNHGGRQFDRSVTSVEALPGICQAVDGAIPVYFDSGVRDAAHIAVTLALGAEAVLVGRPVLVALAAAGPEGVSALLRDLTADLGQIMRLVGAASPRELRDVGAIPAGTLLGLRPDPSRARPDTSNSRSPQ
jgi:isopentenyl diphosphate isomerase/L-lactate dehydrogenase-like FMN-dependent dehydrogenase